MNGTSSLPVSQHKLLAFEYLYSNTFLQNFLQDVFFDCQSARADMRVYFHSSRSKNQNRKVSGGAEGARTLDILLAKQVL